MRLLKLVAVGLATYTIYEFSRSIWSLMGQGQSSDTGGQDAGQSFGGEGMSPAQQADQRRQVLSGSAGDAGGMDVDVTDVDGFTHTQRVGRGVVSR